MNEEAKILIYDPKTETGLCPTCNDIVKPGDKICCNCGQKINWSSVVDIKNVEDI